jgi:hypothetical protein
VLKVFSLHPIIAWGNKLRNWFYLSLQTPGIPFIKLKVEHCLTKIFLFRSPSSFSL